MKIPKLFQSVQYFRTIPASEIAVIHLNYNCINVISQIISQLKLFVVTYVVNNIVHINI